MEKGVNYFDVAPSYGDAEIKLGPALEPYRKDVFLACKTTERTKEGAAAELRESLQRLRTDHLDLYQLHALSDVEKDVDAAFGRAGPWKYSSKRRSRDKFATWASRPTPRKRRSPRWSGINFDSILFPINFATFYEGDFGPRIVAAAKAKGIARLALKAMAKQKWPEAIPCESSIRSAGTSRSRIATRRSWGCISR